MRNRENAPCQSDRSAEEHVHGLLWVSDGWIMMGIQDTPPCWSAVIFSAGKMMSALRLSQHLTITGKRYLSQMLELTNGIQAHRNLNAAWYIIPNGDMQL